MKSAPRTRPRVARERRKTPRLAADEEAALFLAADEPPSPGCVDFFGYSNAAGGWLFSGWAPRTIAIEPSGAPDSVIHFEQTRCHGTATLAFYDREDLGPDTIGVLAFISGSSRAAGSLEHLALTCDGVTCQMQARPGSQRLAEHDMVTRVRATLVKDAYVNGSRDSLLAIISRPAFAGMDTLPALSEQVLLEIDDAFLCPPGDVLVKGWILAAPGIVRAIRVRSGPLVGTLSLAESIRIPRGDVIAAYGEQAGFSDPLCGFMARIPSAISKGDVCYLEVELENGEIAFKPLRLSKQSGITAIKQIMEAIDVRYDELDLAFDRVLGPAVSLLNAARTRDPGAIHELQFGSRPAGPEGSLIIPLYGRIDFLEYQLALFSRHAAASLREIIYVLDDPPRRRELEILAHSTFERFGVPFTVLILPENVGFAAACNIGMRAARGDFIGFVNSDIFPINDGWFESLVARLKRDPSIGVIGPRLLFEDGTIQHEGCYYRRIKEFGNWFFVEHVNKGRIPDDTRGTRVCEAITGACMVMRRSLAAEVGGFDEDYIIGDFEDSDLCLKLRRRNLTCVVADDAQMYHLERKSQAAPSQRWRMNLTLYNAWVHQRRWSEALGALAIS